MQIWIIQELFLSCFKGSDLEVKGFTYANEFGPQTREKEDFFFVLFICVFFTNGFLLG